MNFWITISEDAVYGFDMTATDFAAVMTELAHLLRRKEQNRIKSIRVEIRKEETK